MYVLHRSSKGLWWLCITCAGTFWEAGQVDLRETCPRQIEGSEAALLNWSHSFTYDPDFQTVWAASIAGLDLAWEVGTICSSMRTPSTLSLPLRPKRSNRAGRQVRFLDTDEVYVGLLTSDEKSWHSSEEEADESSWMATTRPVARGDPQPFMNRDAAAVADDQTVAHQNGLDEQVIEMEVEADDSSSSSESDSGEPRRPVIVYSLEWDPMHCRPRWSTYEKMHKDIATQFDISRHDLTTVHAVGAVPADLLAARIQPFVAQLPGDVQEGSTFQLVLIDVEFHNAMPSMAHETVRRVKLFPLTISRKALLAMLGLEAHCRYVRNACLVWHNGDPVHRQNKALINLLHGDYVKIAVPPGRGQLRQHYTREVAQCLRRGYMPSNVPAVLEAHPDGIEVADMPVIDNFNYIPSAADLDYDRDAMSLMQLEGWSVPAYDRWPPFLTRGGKHRPYECKVGDEDLREPSLRHETEETTPVAGRLELHFGDLTNFLQDLFPLWRLYAATEQEEEGNVLYAHTWYTDHQQHPRCDEDRAVRLIGDPWRWPDIIAERWDDRIDPDQTIDLYLVTPSPKRRSWEDADAVPHIIIVQNPRA